MNVLGTSESGHACFQNPKEAVAFCEAMEAREAKATGKVADLHEWAGRATFLIGYETGRRQMAQSTEYERAMVECQEGADDCIKAVQYYFPSTPGLVDQKLRQALARIEALEQIGTKLVAVARAAWTLQDDTADDGENMCVDRADFDNLSAALDELDKLPEKEGFVSTGPAKAERIISPTKIETHENNPFQ